MQRFGGGATLGKNWEEGVGAGPGGQKIVRKIALLFAIFAIKTID